MDFLPLLHRANKKSCLIVGGGVIAQRRAEVIASAGLRVDIVAPEISSSLSSLSIASGGKVLKKEFDINNFINNIETDQYFLIIAATNVREVNAQVHDFARAHNILVNIVDASQDSDVIFPSLITRGSITIAISNNGSSPVFSRLLKEKIAMFLPENYGNLSNFLSKYRDRVNKALPDVKTRVKFWENVIQGPIAEHVCLDSECVEDSEGLADQVFLVALESAKNGQVIGDVYFLDVSHGEVESLTLRAFRLLQQAEIILYDEFLSKELMSLLTRGAKRSLIDIGSECNLDKSIEQLKNYVKQGKRVARLFTTHSQFYAHKDECFSVLKSHGISFQNFPNT